VLFVTALFFRFHLIQTWVFVFGFGNNTAIQNKNNIECKVFSEIR
jgi:hypothetical protein